MCKLQNYNQDFKLLELIAYKYCKIIPWYCKISLKEIHFRIFHPVYLDISLSFYKSKKMDFPPSV